MVQIDPQSQSLVDGMLAAGGPPLQELTPAEARAIPESLIEVIGPGPEIAAVHDLAIPGPAGDIPARVYEPVENAPATIVYYHGGGWVFGSVAASDACVRVLAHESGCRVVSVDYRLAPEHPYPAAVEDAFAAARWTAAEYATPLVVAGDSAGGNLAAVVALRARDEGGPAIAYQVLVYPVTDHTMDTASMEEYAEAPLILNRAGMRWFWDHYAPDLEQRAEPWASPLRAESHTGLPPAYVLVAQHDPLRDEGLAYAAKLQAGGVPVTLRRYDDQIHAFFVFPNLIDAATEAAREIGDALRAAL